jgi:hypothetical protein
MKKSFLLTSVIAIVLVLACNNSSTVKTENVDSVAVDSVNYVVDTNIATITDSVFTDFIK